MTLAANFFLLSNRSDQVRSGVTTRLPSAEVGRIPLCQRNAILVLISAASKGDRTICLTHQGTSDGTN